MKKWAYYWRLQRSSCRWAGYICHTDVAEIGECEKTWIVGDSNSKPHAHPLFPIGIHQILITKFRYPEAMFVRILSPLPSYLHCSWYVYSETVPSCSYVWTSAATRSPGRVEWSKQQMVHNMQKCSITQDNTNANMLSIFKKVRP